MKNALSFSVLFKWALMAAVFTAVVFPFFFVVPIILWTGLIIWGVSRGEVKFEWKLISSFFIGLYLLYLVGIVNTEFQEIGLKYLEYKMGLVLLPALFCFQPKERIEWSAVVKSFIAAIGVAGILGLINLLKIGDLSISGVAKNFSYIHHPTYFSMFCLLAMELVRQNYLANRKAAPMVKIGLYIALVLIQLLCLSFAGVIVLMIYLGIIALMWIWGWQNKVLKGIFTFGIPSAILIAFVAFPPLKSQLNESLNPLKSYLRDPMSFVQEEREYFEGNTVRLIMWTATAEIILEHPIGIGTGDLDSELSKKLRKWNQPEEMISKHYNPHNQFLQIGAEIGWLGMILFFSIFLVLVRAGRKKGNVPLLLLTLVVGFNCLFESILQRQSGLVFFVLWTLILSYWSSLQKPLPEE